MFDRKKHPRRTSKMVVFVAFILLTATTLPPALGAEAAESDIGTQLHPAVPCRLDHLPEIEIAPGISGRIAWNKHVMINRMTVNPGSVFPFERLGSECITLVMEGRIEQYWNGGYVTMNSRGYERMTPVSGHRGKHDFMLLEKGTEHAFFTKSESAVVYEFYSPPRRDLIEKAGVADLPSPAADVPLPAEPSVTPGAVNDLYDVQFTGIADGIWSRLINGRHIQLSFGRIDPNGEFAENSMSPERIRIVTRGDLRQTAGKASHDMPQSTMIHIPEGMAHREATGGKGCDVLDIIAPVCPEYVKKMAAQLAKFHELIPEGETIELVADGAVSGPGLCYTEGPSWIDGRLYFSNMAYDAGWKGFPEKSALVAMDPYGTYRYVNTGLELNGTFPLGNGNLAVCDMYGRRIVEMSTGGEILRTLADSWDGTPFDGPNDLAVDDKGGIYFSDPQIVPKPHYQPGRSIFYRRPDGEVIRVMEPGVLAKPNGLILSPDCKMLYVNSTPENFMMAGDIQPDGSVTNYRKFGRIRLTPEILDQESINPQVDGMTVDDKGNVYITSILGLQIFAPSGNFIGYIHFPLMPVNCCFGDEDGRTLYINCNDKVYKIRTNVKGAAYTLKRNR